MAYQAGANFMWHESTRSISTRASGWNTSPLHGLAIARYTPQSEKGIVKIKCIAQERNTMDLGRSIQSSLSHKRIYVKPSEN